ncbi:uncharacterized protein [Watersipora subatra]|uniref:uncharacterized protein n=1 Tax=Watersipora subatra TaxID=2589382 RepID=UPI00355B2C49
MADLEYVDQLARSYKERAEVSGKWRDYLQAHGIANFCVTLAPTTERHRLVYDIEESWYKGKHPLSYDEHRQMISNHKALLEKYRGDTRKDFGKLDDPMFALNNDDFFRKKNLLNAKSFCEKVFAASKTCSEGLINVSKIILQSSVDVLKKRNEEAPCKFAIVGLGSIAKGDATPYSDLEYAIIVEKASDYFEKLAVDSYFRIGNLGESPLKSFDIDELKTNSELKRLAKMAVTGYRIDGITTNSGNIPTGNGKEGGLSLTLTVEQLMELYRNEAEKPLGHLADKSDMLSSTVIIFSSEDSPDQSQLHDQFASKRNSYEEFFVGAKVKKKRFDLFTSDINKYIFLPEFVSFQPPQNLNVTVKENIFRYPTLLANNLKMCLRLTFSQSWKIYEEMKKQGLLSSENLQYFNLLLALSIYIRTSSYLKMRSQAEFVQVGKYYQGSHISSYAVSSHLVVIMGCLLIPIKRFIKSRMLELKSSVKTNKQSSIDVSLLLLSLQVPHEDFWLKSEVLYFTGQYREATEEVSQAIGRPITSTSFAELKEIIHLSVDDVSFNKRLQLFAYLLYYSHNYKLALECFQYFSKKQPQQSLWKLLAAHCSKQIGDYRAAQKLLKEAEQSLEMPDVNTSEGVDESHRDTLITYTNIGLVYRDLSEYEKALRYLTKALSINKALHPDTKHAIAGRSLNNVGLANNCLGDNEQGNYCESSDKLEASMEYEIGAIHPDIATSYNNIGSVYDSLGDYIQALEYHKKALDMQKAVYGDDTNHTHIAVSYNNIGLVYNSALEHHKKALDMQKAMYGEDTNHTHIATSYNNIGSIYDSLGEYRQALEYHTKALDMRKAVFRDDTNHTDIANSYNNIGVMYSSLGNFGQALEYHMKSLDMKKAVYGEDTNHTHIAVSYNNIGLVYNSALEHHKKALDMQKAMYGEDTNHTHIATSYNNIGSIYDSLGEYRQALEYHTKALDMRKAVFRDDTNHTDIANSYNNIGVMYSSLGNFGQALEYHMKSLDMKKAVYGEDTNHIGIAVSYNNIGSVYSSVGVYRRALENHKKALDMQKAMYGEDTNNTHIVISYNKIGSVYKSLGDYRQALEYLMKALDTQKAAYGRGAEHFGIVGTCRNIGLTYYSLGDYRRALEYYTKGLNML